MAFVLGRSLPVASFSESGGAAAFDGDESGGACSYGAGAGAGDLGAGGAGRELERDGDVQGES